MCVCVCVGGCACVCGCVCVCGSPVLAVDARSARTSQAGHRLTEMSSAVNLKGIWPRRAPAVHAAGGLGAFYLFVCLFVYLFIFKISRGSCLCCLNAIYGPGCPSHVYEYDYGFDQVDWTISRMADCGQNP